MIDSLSKFNSRRLSLPSETESKKTSMIKELRVDYRKCFTNSNLSSTAKRVSPPTLRVDLLVVCRECCVTISSLTHRHEQRYRCAFPPSGCSMKYALARSTYFSCVFAHAYAASLHASYTFCRQSGT